MGYVCGRMSYSESEATLVLFSHDRLTLTEYVSAIRDELDTRGAEYKGPITFEQVAPSKLAQFLRHLREPDSDSTVNADKVPDWLFRAVSNEENLTRMIEIAEAERVVFGREFKVYGENAIRAVLDRNCPPEVSIMAELGSREHHKGGRNVPYTYDPNVDHLSDI